LENKNNLSEIRKKCEIGDTLSDKTPQILSPT